MASYGKSLYPQQNMKTKVSSLFFLLLLYLLPYLTQGQSISINAPGVEDYLRRQQLLGNIDSFVSFMIRPLYPAIAFGKENGIDVDGTFTDFETSTSSFVSADG